MVSTKAKLAKKIFLSEPKIEQRNEKNYVGIRTQVPLRKMSKAIPQLLADVFTWLGNHGIAQTGDPFIRYHVINMTEMMDIELCVPVARPVTGDERVKPGALPGGQYAALDYTGVRNGIKANAALLDWGARQGLVWDRWDVEAGDAFRSRYETFLTDPKDEPDKAKWETEVAIRLVDSHIAKATVIIHAPASKIWDALTKPELIKQYLFGTDVTSDWQVGSPIRYKGVWQGKPYEDKGKVLQFQPYKLIVSTFWSSLSGLPDSPENYKTVRYELSPDGSGTRLSLTQDNNASEEEARHSEQNWKMVLDGIKKMVEG